MGGLRLDLTIMAASTKGHSAAKTVWKAVGMGWRYCSPGFTVATAMAVASRVPAILKLLDVAGEKAKQDRHQGA